MSEWGTTSYSQRDSRGRRGASTHEAGHCKPGHGTGVDAPRRQTCPKSQILHATFPSLGWYLPPGQGSQLFWRCESAEEPGLQGVGSVEPVEQLLPAVQLAHCSGADKSVADVKLPAMQGSGDEAPGGQ